MESKELEFTEEDQKMLDKLLKKQKKEAKKKKHKKKSKEDSDHSYDESSPSSQEPKPKKRKVKEEAKKQQIKLEVKDEEQKHIQKDLKLNEEGEVCFELNPRKKVQVRNFRGRALIDIREFFSKDGQSLPTKRGIALNEDVWKALKEAIPKIDSAIKQIK